MRASPLIQPLHGLCGGEAHALQPIQNEQRALDAPSRKGRDGQAVLARSAAEFAQHQRYIHRALLMEVANRGFSSQ